MVSNRRDISQGKVGCMYYSMHACKGGTVFLRLHTKGYDTSLYVLVLYGLVKVVKG